MPGKTYAHHVAALLKKQSAQPRQARSSSGDRTPVPTSAGAAANEDDEEADASDEADKTPTRSRAAVQAPSIATDRPVTPTTPTTQPRKLLAGLELNAPKPAGSQSNAVDRKMAELQASGWRPDEELADMGAEDDEEDEDYDGVDLISHSDEDDAAIRATENKMFAEPGMSLQDQGSLARRLSLSDAGEDELEWNGFDDAGFASFADSFTADDEKLPSFMLKDDTDLLSSKPEGQRKVRFQDEVDRSDDSSDSDEAADEFPDIFSDFNIRPYYTKTHDDEIDDGSDAGSVWDFEGDEMNVDDDDDDDDDDTASLGSTGSSSGYDSDDGETTDEEACEPIQRPSPPAPERTTPADDTTASTSKVNDVKGKNRMTRSKAVKKPSPPPVHHTPKFGTFELDPRRNVLIVSGAGVTQKNKLYPAKIQTPQERRLWQKLRETYKNSNASPRTSVQMDIEDDSDYEMEQSMFSPGGPFSPAGTLNADNILGPAEAFHPFTSVDTSGMVTEDASMQSYSEDEDPMDLISPYINFDGDEDDEDNSADTSDANDGGPLARKRSNTMPSFPSSAPGTPATPSLSRADTLGSEHGGVSHLTHTPSLVSSFRLNQEIAKELASYASDPSARFLRSEHNAMQAGRRRAANTPITPMRKKRGGSLSKIGNISWSKGLNLDKDIFLTDPKKKPSQHARRMSTGRGLGRMGKGSSFR